MPPPDPSRRAPLWILAGLYALLVGAGVTAAAAAPPEETQGEAARLLLVHVPSVIAAYVALVVGLAAALWYLARRSSGADLVSASAVEIGGLFIGLNPAHRDDLGPDRVGSLVGLGRRPA